MADRTIKSRTEVMKKEGIYETVYLNANRFFDPTPYRLELAPRGLVIRNTGFAGLFR